MKQTYNSFEEYWTDLKKIIEAHHQDEQIPSEVTDNFLGQVQETIQHTWNIAYASGKLDLNIKKSLLLPDRKLKL